MPFTFSTEQEQLRDGVRRLLAERARPRDCYEGSTPPDRELWLALAAMGVAGLGIDAEAGGSGGDIVDQIAIAEEVGRALAPCPFLSSTMVAGPLVAAAGNSEQRARLGGGIAAGELLVATALDVPDLRTAKPDGNGWRVSGPASLVIDGPSADILIVAAHVDAAARLFAIPASAEGVQLIPLPTLDRTRALADVLLDSAPADLLDGSATLLDDARRSAEIGLAAEAVGAAATALQMSADYAKDRRQFGTPIGTFQGVKHRIADMLVAVENARSAAYHGAWALAGGWSGADVAVAMAKAIATENAVAVADGAIQVFGGIGCTWEHDIHLYLRRAKSCELLLGEPAHHLERIASALLDAEGV